MGAAHTLDAPQAAAIGRAAPRNYSVGETGVTEIHPEANARLEAFERALALRAPAAKGAQLFAGVDLGTAYIVTAVVNAEGRAVAGMVTRSRASVRDGLVFDYLGATNLLRAQVEVIRRSGYPIRDAMVCFPPGTEGRNARVFANVLEAADLHVVGLLDEPSSAAEVLEIAEGAVVDIGGGTTGISVIEDGKVVYTADEPTGGTHLDLVLAGNFRISTDEAEQMKTDPARQGDLFPVVRPVFQKIGAIVRRHLAGRAVRTIYLVGGTSCFPGIAQVVREETGLPVLVPEHALLVTPLGIAMRCAREAARG